ncbi:MAG: hypothetical protein KGL39_12025 [Patescibacteria group bacterium]|nr:hypothetical protein [Patescibacteria group bacterium]
MHRCYFCDRTDTTFCSLCRQWFCADHRTAYYMRIAAAAKEHVPGLGGLLRRAGLG